MSEDHEQHTGMVLFTLGPALANGLVSAAREMVEALGFEILLQDEEERLLCLDVFPTEVTAELRTVRPKLDNGRVAKAELYVRRIAHAAGSNESSQALIASTDTGAEAWRRAAELWPDRIESIAQIVEDRHAALHSEHVVVRDLSRWGHRSKVELIEYRDDLAVKKTFREPALAAMEREIAFLQEFAPQRPDIVPVIARGRNYFIMPYVRSKPIARKIVVGVRLPHLLKLRHVRQVADLMRFLFAKGIDPIDFVPHNLLIDEADRIHAIDFEYAHRAGALVDPLQAASLVGVGDNFPGDWPRTAVWVRTHPYRNRWYAYTGLPLRSFLFDPPWLQRVKRLGFLPRFAARKVVERFSRSAQPAGWGSGEPGPT